MADIIKIVGTIAAIVLPLWNIPLILRIKSRKSSQDVSLWWVWGVWVCPILMLPAGLLSQDIVFKAFTIVNFILFSLVLFYVARFR